MKQNYMDMSINQFIKLIEERDKEISELKYKLVSLNTKLERTKIYKEKEKWNYDLDSCPLNTEVYLLLRNATYVCEESIYTGIITKEPYGDSKIKWDCRKYFSGNPNNFYQDAIVAWRPYKDNE